MRVISLTTDFGLSDWFVGSMKGVIAGIQPDTRIIDLTHGISPGNIHAAAFALAVSYDCFPTRTIHVVVVDPGVGSARPAIAVRTRRYDFVAPDNGVLSFALAKETLRSVRRLERAEFFHRPVSHTFHGRDIFAPVAASLSQGLAFSRLGPKTDAWVRLPWPEVQERPSGLRGEVVHIDRFGNAITNLKNSWVEETPSLHGTILLRSKAIRVRDCYAAVPPGSTVAVPGSTGYLELAMNGGSIAEELHLKVGDTLTLKRRSR